MILPVAFWKLSEVDEVVGSGPHCLQGGFGNEGAAHIGVVACGVDELSHA